MIMNTMKSLFAASLLALGTTSAMAQAMADVVPRASRDAANKDFIVFIIISFIN